MVIISLSYILIYLFYHSDCILAVFESYSISSGFMHFCFGLPSFERKKKKNTRPAIFQNASDAKEETELESVLHVYNMCNRLHDYVYMYMCFSLHVNIQNIQIYSFFLEYTFSRVTVGLPFHSFLHTYA